MSRPSKPGWLTYLNNFYILTIYAAGGGSHEPIIARPIISLPPNLSGKLHAPQFLAGNIFKAASLGDT
jgi:hypothetical protein